LTRLEKVRLYGHATIIGLSVVFEFVKLARRKR
jgi:hypothetical protein